MEYEKVVEECKKIIPYITWGNLEKEERYKDRLTFGFENPLNFLGENIFKFDSLIEAIWKHKDKSIYYLSRNDIEKFVIQILREIKNTDKLTVVNNKGLKDQWNELLSRKMQSYYVAFPIYGIIVPKITKLGAFTAFNSSDYKKFIIENNSIAGKHILQFLFIKDNLNYLVLSIKSRDTQRAIEVAKPHFELFEYAAKFWLQGDKHFDIGIFNYNAFHSEEGHAFKEKLSDTDGFASSSKSKGAFQPINIQDLAYPQIQFFWDILSRYINGTTTEIENRLINAIRWVGMANNDNSEITQYVQYVFAIEALLSHRPAGEMIVPSISFQLAEYAAFIVGENANEKVISKQELRLKIFKDVKEIYSNRSKIVHGNDTTMNKILLVNAREFIYKLIYSIMNNKKILQFTSMNELSNWINELKFAS